jgi:hypothetical protein
VEAKAGDPRFRFGNQGTTFDPSSQTEDVGNDPVRASTYAVKNLKFVAKNLADWTSKKTNDYEDLIELNDELLSSWSRYVGHVTTMVGGVYEQYTKPNQNIFSYNPVPKASQQSAVNWIVANAFSNVDWLINKEVVTHHMMGYVDRIRSLQASPLNRMLSLETFARLDNSALTTPNNYKTIDLFQDVRGGIWSELASGKNIDQYRRNLQKAYIERMKTLMTDQAPAPPSPYGARETYPVAQSDVRSIVRGELKSLQASLAASKAKFADKEVRYHLDDCLERVSLILNPRK